MIFWYYRYRYHFIYYIVYINDTVSYPDRIGRRRSGRRRHAHDPGLSGVSDYESTQKLKVLAPFRPTLIHASSS